MNVYRLPFKAERVQPFPGGPLSTTELQRYDASVNYITQTKGKYAFLDPHGFGQLFGGKVGESPSTISVFADFWSKVATYYKNNPKVCLFLVFVLN